MGKLYSFSGIDSSGKTYYIKEIEEYLIKSEIRYKFIWSRGGYTAVFEWFKNVLRLFLGRKLPPSGINPEREKMFKNGLIGNLWYFLAILDLIRLYTISIRLSLFLGNVILCDRYIWDTYIDLSLRFTREKVDRSVLWQILVFSYKRPDISIYLNVSAEESMRRSIEKKEEFCESIDIRRERIEEYRNLVANGAFDAVLDTEKMNPSSVRRTILEMIKK